MPTPQAYQSLWSQYEELRLAAIRVCISEHGPQCADPAPELSRLWDLVGDFCGDDLAKAEQQAKEAEHHDDTMEGDLDSWDGL